VETTFVSPLIEWRGPAPFYFVALPDELGVDIKAMANSLTYGWGVIPVAARVGQVEFTTSLIPRRGVYLLPIKNAVRLPNALTLGEDVKVELSLNF
jgi:Domain of unknown function (DUF1905)